MEIAGQVAVVTGGGRGLGKAFALALAQAGAHVAVTSRTESELGETVAAVEQAGGTATALVADVTDGEAAQRVVATVEQRWGRVDLLVNNAGTFRAFGAIAEIDPDEWWREVDINLRGPFLYTRAVLPGMIERRSGRIINLASGGGLQPFETSSAYNVAKTALIRLTESTDLEAAAHGVAVFALDPGRVRTSMTDYVVSPRRRSYLPRR